MGILDMITVTAGVNAAQIGPELTKRTSNMSNSSFALIILLTSLFVGNAYSESLDSLGWVKTSDDFEGTVSYAKESSQIGVSECGSFSVNGTVGLVMGDPKTKPLVLSLSFYGSEDRFDSKGKLKIKTDAGITNTDVSCNSKYGDGKYTAQCFVVNINNGLANKLSTTKYARISLPSKNIDLKLGGDCSKTLLGINELASEYLKSQ
jgi:hypothetical protein